MNRMIQFAYIIICKIKKDKYFITYPSLYDKPNKDRQFVLPVLTP